MPRKNTKSPKLFVLDGSLEPTDQSPVLSTSFAPKSIKYSEDKEAMYDSTCSLGGGNIQKN